MISVRSNERVTSTGRLTATSPPLTAEKVVQWTTERDNPLLLWRRDETTPVGYGELNRTIKDLDDLWIGHLIVPRELQGQGLGYAFMQHLLHRAFLDWSVALHFRSSRDLSDPGREYH